MVFRAIKSIVIQQIIIQVLILFSVYAFEINYNKLRKILRLHVLNFFHLLVPKPENMMNLQDIVCSMVYYNIIRNKSSGNMIRNNGIYQNVCPCRIIVWSINVNNPPPQYLMIIYLISVVNCITPKLERIYQKVQTLLNYIVVR